MRVRKTERGFERIDFKDMNGNSCSLQESSLATEYAIWLGVNESRMHLGKKQLRELIERLESYLMSNSFKNPGLRRP